MNEQGKFYAFLTCIEFIFVAAYTELMPKKKLSDRNLLETIAREVAQQGKILTAFRTETRKSFKSVGGHLNVIEDKLDERPTREEFDALRNRVAEIERQLGVAIERS